MPTSARSSRSPWDPLFPSTLVVSCSDGRFTRAVAGFVQDELAIARYDELVVPGGGGALVDGGGPSGRTRHLLADAAFLVQAHQIEAVLVFVHGPAPDGPPEAVCGDYRRRLPKASVSVIRERQRTDVAEVVRRGFGLGVRVAAYGCEVDRNGRFGFELLQESA